MYTRNTVGTGRGMPQCPKTQNRTRTCVTRFGSTAGKPVPVFNPTLEETMLPLSLIFGLVLTVIVIQCLQTSRVRVD